MVFILLLVRKVSRIAVVFSGLVSKKRERKSGLTTDLTSDRLLGTGVAPSSEQPRWAWLLATVCR